MIEILAAAVTGSAFGWEASSFFDDKGGPPNMGHVLIAIDAGRLSAGAFDSRMSDPPRGDRRRAGRAPAWHAPAREPRPRRSRRRDSHARAARRDTRAHRAPGLSFLETRMPEIVISEFMDEAAIHASFAGRDVLYDPKLVDDSARLTAAVRDARALIVRNRTQVRGALLESATHLRGGRAARRRARQHRRTRPAKRVASRCIRPPGANDLSVAEYVITAALVLLRKAWFATARVAAGEWPRTELMGRELAGKRLGLVGYGAIARVTGRMGRDLGMSVAAYDPLLPADHPAWAGALRQALPELLATSDVVSLHVPLTDTTRNMHRRRGDRGHEARLDPHQCGTWRSRGRGCALRGAARGTSRRCRARRLRARTGGRRRRRALRGRARTSSSRRTSRASPTNRTCA